jgi:NAD(P)H-dependent flavin oxidoreductase YrpB (nitropropane dioxygenase family)
LTAARGARDHQGVRTPVCDLPGIDVPVACAPFGPWDQVELAAAVCEAGGLRDGGPVRARARGTVAPAARSHVAMRIADA